MTLASPLWVFLLVLASTGLLAYSEFDHIVAASGIARSGWPGMAAGLVLLLVPNPLMFVVLLVMLGMLLALRVHNLAAALPAAGAFSLGVVYIFGAWRCAADLRAVNPHWLLFAMLLSWAGDIAALYIGRPFGKHKLAPRVSPAKSREVRRRFGRRRNAGRRNLRAPPQGFPKLRWAWRWPWPRPVISQASLATCVNQRSSAAPGVKDSGTLLPGHGGWLDRIDSSLFSVPVVYALVKFL